MLRALRDTSNPFHNCELCARPRSFAEFRAMLLVDAINLGLHLGMPLLEQGGKLADQPCGAEPLKKDFFRRALGQGIRQCIQSLLEGVVTPRPLRSCPNPPRPVPKVKPRRGTAGLWGFTWQKEHLGGSLSAKSKLQASRELIVPKFFRRSARPHPFFKGQRGPG